MKWELYSPCSILLINLYDRFLVCSYTLAFLHLRFSGPFSDWSLVILIPEISF